MAVAANVVDSLQRQASTTTASPLYGHLLSVAIDDIARGGPCAAVLRHCAPEIDPWAQAVPLRFLGGLHRIVLEGRAPVLARHYGSVGGVFDGSNPGTSGDDFIASVAEHADELIGALDRPVQTNEVGRAALLVGGYIEIARRTGLPLRLLEVGASAGLNMRWDSYFYDTGSSTFGDPASGLRFEGVWEGDVLPDLAVDVTVADRGGCDLNPIDATTDEGALTLLSYVWPDQALRIAHLRGAIDIARAVPVRVERADAGAWVTRALATPTPAVATVVVHSIVLQYLSKETRDRVRDAIRTAGASATSDSTIHWLRMEPAGPVADLRLTSWAGVRGGGVDEVLATAGYHGAPVRWASVR